MPLIEPLKFRKSGSTVVAPAEMEPGDQIPGAYISDVAGSNLLINGDMRINQRLFAGGSLAAGAFGYDRWFADTGGCNVSVSTAGVISHVSGTLCQAIEAPRGAFGVTVTVRVDDLSGGNLTGSVGGVAFTITPGTGARYASVLAPASSASGNLLVKLTGTGLTYRNVGVVRGADMSGSEQRNQAVEQLLASRYFFRGLPWPEGLNFCPYAANAYFSWPIIFAVPMRAVPAASFSLSGYTAGGINTGVGTGGIDLMVNRNGARILVQSSGATTNAFFTFGSSYFTFDAEITS
ncbi:hypothetical protein [Xanthomonas citri]|uniref:hypothetical protein n=1 Tax=Xanthomonas citri TaxID=346 RepID=UPI000B5CF9C8|nr:hypothetical protein [Xanthomonas citri]ASL01750.1 hypothetical protein XcvCFBP7113P_16640 [Xanthomonas citri pv. vignicola]